MEMSFPWFLLPPGPRPTQACQVSAGLLLLLLAWVCVGGGWWGGPPPDCLSIFGCQSVCQSAHLIRLPSATRNLQSAIPMAGPSFPPMPCCDCRSTC